MAPIATSRIQTKSLAMIVSSAVTLSFGVALIANYLTEVIDQKIFLVVSGLILILVSLLFIAKLANPRVKQIIRIRGGFFLEPTKLVSKEIVGYDFNEDMAEYLRAICIENKALSRAMKRGYDSHIRIHDLYNPDNLDYFNLSASCAEFIFLKQLSMHLNSYFVNEEIDKSLVKTIPRKEMSTDILRNRVLELITRDHQEREAFCDDHEPDGEISLCYAVSDDGKIFNRLELELPYGSTLKRLPDNSLKIANDVFEINCLVRCDSTNTFIQPELILGSFESPILVCIKLEVTVKKSIFLSSNEIKLYQWLDSFLIRFENYMSIEKLHSRSMLQLVKILKSQKRA